MKLKNKKKDAKTAKKNNHKKYHNFKQKII